MSTIEQELEALYPAGPPADTPAEEQDESPATDPSESLVDNFDYEAHEGEPIVEEEAAEPVEAPVEVTYDDGSTERLSPEEAERAYLRHADYTRKMMEMSAQRRAIEADAAQAAAKRKEYVETLQTLQQHLNPTLIEPDISLLDTDLDEYRRQEAIYQHQKRRADWIQAEQNRVAEEQRQEQEAAYNQWVKTESERLLERIPAWREPKVRESEMGEIRTYAHAKGMTDDTLARIDSVGFDILRDAMMYQQLKLRRGKANGKIAKTPVLKKGSRLPQTPDTDVDKAMNRLEKTGSPEAGVDALMALRAAKAQPR